MKLFAPCVLLFAFLASCGTANDSSSGGQAVAPEAGCCAEGAAAGAASGCCSEGGAEKAGAEKAGCCAEGGAGAGMGAVEMKAATGKGDCCEGESKAGCQGCADCVPMVAPVKASGTN